MKMFPSSLLLGFCLSCLVAVAQNDSFEVASVKPAEGRDNNKISMSGGPGTGDPGRIDYRNVELITLIRSAYDAYAFQVEAPTWLSIEKYDIAAKIPPGASKDQVRTMMRNLLEQRFHLVIHHDVRTVPGYELVMARKDPQFRKAGAGEKPDISMKWSMEPNAKRPLVVMTAKAQPLDGLVRTIGEDLQRPVTDKTGLHGVYDYTFEFSPSTGGAPTPFTVEDRIEPDGSGPHIFSAVRTIGLRLVASRVPFEFLVVEKCDRVPVAN